MSARVETRLPAVPEAVLRHRAALAAATPEHIERLRWSAERIAEHQRHRLRHLLAVAKEGSPWRCCAAPSHASSASASHRPAGGRSLPSRPDRASTPPASWRRSPGAGGPIAATTVPVTLPLQEVVARLNDLQPMAVAAYPSALSLLVAEREAGRLTITPFAVSSTSEHLPAELRARVESSFGVGVVDTFGSTEGLVGASEPGDPRIVLAGDQAIVELVDEAGAPVPAGTPSAKVLVTNLVNTVQPLIRYELSDRFVRHPDHPDHGHPLVTVEGRDDDGFRYDGVVVQPLAVRSALLRSPGILEYQVVQTPKGVEVRYVASGPVDTAVVERAVAAALAGAGVDDPDVHAVPVEAIARHLATGKARRFVTLVRSQRGVSTLGTRRSRPVG